MNITIRLHFIYYRYYLYCSIYSNLQNRTAQIVKSNLATLLTVLLVLLWLQLAAVSAWAFPLYDRTSFLLFFSSFFTIMALSKSSNTYGRTSWEDSVIFFFISICYHVLKNYNDCLTQEFPILCPTCLGDNPYVRMVSTYS